MGKQWTRIRQMTRTTTRRTQKTIRTATTMTTRIKRRHPRLVLVAGRSQKKRARRNDRLLGRKRSRGLKSDLDPSPRKSHARNPAREADLARRSALDPAPRSARAQNPRNAKALVQSLGSERKVDRSQKIERGRKTGRSRGSAPHPGSDLRIGSVMSRRRDRAPS